MVVEQKEEDSSTINQIFSITQFINPRTTFFALFSIRVQQQSEFHCWVTCKDNSISKSNAGEYPSTLGNYVRLFLCVLRKKQSPSSAHFDLLLDDQSSPQYF